jgi:lactoylglutathione lyase
VAGARLVGINHVALEVGSVEEALALYGRLFAFDLRGHKAGLAFIDIGDQFVAVSEPRQQPADGDRHVGLVVDDVDAVRAAVRSEGLEILPGPGLAFLDPWGNHLQVVAYCDVQFDHTPGVKRQLGIEGLAKSDEARREIAERGLG